MTKKQKRLIRKEVLGFICYILWARSPYDVIQKWGERNAPHVITLKENLLVKINSEWNPYKKEWFPDSIYIEDESGNSLKEFNGDAFSLTDYDLSSLKNDCKTLILFLPSGLTNKGFYERQQRRNQANPHRPKGYARAKRQRFGSY